MLSTYIGSWAGALRVGQTPLVHKQSTRAHGSKHKQPLAESGGYTGSNCRLVASLVPLNNGGNEVGLIGKHVKVAFVKPLATSP